MTVKACVFDAYGTLFDVNAAAREVAADPARKAFGAVWQEVAANWRAKQLQYTWLRAITGAHADFWTVTEDGLDWALDAAGLRDDGLRDALLALYWKLSAYPEVPAMLRALKAQGHATAILSNGAPGMLAGAVESAGIGGWLDDVLSVEAVGVFKPHDSVYQLVPDRFGCAPEAVLFVSSNGWDVAAASGFGFRSIWVNRDGAPVDRLPWQPAKILDDLTPIPDIAEAF